MEQARIAGTTLEYEIVGDGEPVALKGETFLPLPAELALTDPYCLARYDRRGYAGSSHTCEPISVRSGMPRTAGRCSAGLAWSGSMSSAIRTAAWSRFCWCAVSPT
jgi:hypothetical protein